MFLIVKELIPLQVSLLVNRRVEIRKSLSFVPPIICKPFSLSSCDGISENDRNTIKEKIKNAFKKRSNENYDELLELCTSLTEENVYFPAPSRLDYYKNGINEVKRIFEKAEEIKTISEINKSGNELEEGQKSLKRAKTQH